jgi:hypothetical protein
VNGEFRIFSRFYFDDVRFARVAALPAAKIRSANLKTVIAKAYELPPVKHRQTMRFQRFEREIAAMVGLPARGLGLLEAVTGTIGDGDAVYYQELYIPPNERVLELPRSML